MRYTSAFASGSLCLFLTSFAAAQELSVGRYSGTSTGATPGSQVSLAVDIKSVQNGVVEGKGERRVTRQDGKRLDGGCQGEFALTGTIKGDAVDLRSADKFGTGGDCTFRLIGSVSGNKIVGKVGKTDIELTR